MSFFNETNRKRVAKIMETLELISKSGASNDIDREDMQSMMEPLIQAMAELSPAVGYPSEAPATDPELPENTAPTSKAPMCIQLREAAQTASLQDLTWAMAVFLDRLNEELAPKTN